MRRHLLLLVLAAVPALAQTASPVPATAKPAPPPATLRSTLLHQLQTTHNKPEWFTPINAAVAGLTPEEARWVPTNASGKLDPNANHSVGMLANHLLFYNLRSLATLRGAKAPPPPATNEETFNNFDATQWQTIVRDLDTNLTAIEDWVAHASEADLARNARLLANIATHNAYHTGQILYVRKLQGAWNPANGVS